MVMVGGGSENGAWYGGGGCRLYVRQGLDGTSRLACGMLSWLSRTEAPVALGSTANDLGYDMLSRGAGRVGLVGV